MITGTLDWLQTLADTTRVRLLAVLNQTELSVGELCDILQLPQSTISRHLKVLSADGWVGNRREGTNQLYSLSRNDWNENRSQLWEWVGKQHQVWTTSEQDLTRLNQILAERIRSEAFLKSAAHQWDKLRVDLFGSQLDAFTLAAAMPADAVVAELGCGSAPIAQLVAPYVKEVVAIDNSDAMLVAARERLKEHSNIKFELAALTELPMKDCFDIAWLVLVLPYVRDPAVVLNQTAQTLRMGKPLVIVDLLPHDRQSYRHEMGHVRLGTTQADLEKWLEGSEMRLTRFVPLPPDRQARGPALFAAVCQRRNRSDDSN